MNNLSQTLEDLYQDYQPLHQVKNQLISKHGRQNFEELVIEKTKELDEKFRQRIYDELFDWGPIQELKDRNDIFDIIIQGAEKIFFETPEGLQNHSDQFLSERSFKNFVDRITRDANILVDKLIS